MRAFAHVLVYNVDGHWSASFSGTAEISFGGADPADAIRRLIGATSADLDVEQIVAVEDATRDGHLEFLIPYNHRWRIPVPSPN